MINTNNMNSAEEKKVMNALKETTGNALYISDFGLGHPNINEKTIEKFANKVSSFDKNRATFRFLIINAIDDTIFVYDNLMNSTLSVTLDWHCCELVQKWFKKYEVQFTLVPDYPDQKFENTVLDTLGLTYDKLVAGFLRFRFNQMLFVSALDEEKAKRKTGLRDLNIKAILVRLSDSYYLDIETPIKYSKQLTKETYDILYHLTYEELVELVRNCFAI